MNNTSALYDTFKIICKNALDVITFGMYQPTNGNSKIMELNNNNISGNIMCEEMDEKKIKKKELVEQLIR
jgi:hypothetical protein